MSDTRFHKKRLVVECGRERDLIVAAKRVPAAASPRVAAGVAAAAAAERAFVAPPSSYWSGAARAALRSRQVSDELYYAAVDEADGGCALLSRVAGTTPLPLTGERVGPQVRNGAAEMVKLALRGRAQWEHALRRRQFIAQREAAASAATAAAVMSSSSYSPSRPRSAAALSAASVARLPSAILSARVATAAGGAQQQQLPLGERIASASVAAGGVPSRPGTAATAATARTATGSVTAWPAAPAGGRRPHSAVTSIATSGFLAGAAAGGDGGGTPSGASKAAMAALFRTRGNLPATLTPLADRWAEFDAAFLAPEVSSRAIVEFERRAVQMAQLRAHTARQQAEMRAAYQSDAAAGATARRPELPRANDAKSLDELRDMAGTLS
jgi:hypothetical protein